jgi:cell wall-associated NlpC family hydrolase
MRPEGPPLALARMSTWRDNALFSPSRRKPREGPHWGHRWGLRQRSLAALGTIALAAAAGAGAVKLSEGSSAGSHPARLGDAVTAPPLSAAHSGSPPDGSVTAHGAGAAAGAGARSAEVRDPEEARSFPVSPQARAQYRNAATPARAADASVAPGALSTAQVRKDLAQEQALEHAEQTSQATEPGGDSVGGNGTIPIPPDIPTTVQQVIAGANAITDLPYVYGGGHASFVDNAYDCSGSVSYALAAGGLLSAPETSGELESWGAPGPGKWITVYASEGHVYMYVNIGGAWMRFDTVGRSGPFASRWQPDARSNEGFVARHWPGL